MPHSGIIICGEIGSNVAGLVFTDMEEPLYILPRHIFNVSPQKRALLSKTQILKHEKIPPVGESIEFSVDTAIPNNRIINKMALQAKMPEREFVYGQNGTLQMKVHCVVSNESTRRCWSRMFGLIHLPEKFAQCVMPNVVYSSLINVFVNLGDEEHLDCDEEVNLEFFNPSLNIEFDSFGAVQLDEGYLRSAPWNRDVPFIINPRELDLVDPIDVIIETKIDEFRDHILNANCLIIGMLDLFCSAAPLQRIKMGHFFNRNMIYAPGCQYICSMYPCRYNKCWIVYQCTMRSGAEKFPVDYLPDGTTIFRIPLVSTAFPDRYYNEFTGYVSDPKQLIANSKWYRGTMSVNTGLVYPPCTPNAAEANNALDAPSRLPRATSHNASSKQSIPTMCEYRQAWVRLIDKYKDLLDMYPLARPANNAIGASTAQNKNNTVCVFEVVKCCLPVYI